MLGADRIAVGLSEELRVQGVAGRSGSRGSIGGLGPARLSCDLSDQGPFGRRACRHRRVLRPLRASASPWMRCLCRATNLRDPVEREVLGATTRFYVVLSLHGAVTRRTFLAPSRAASHATAASTSTCRRHLSQARNARPRALPIGCHSDAGGRRSARGCSVSESSSNPPTAANKPSGVMNQAGTSPLGDDTSNGARCARDSMGPTTPTRWRAGSWISTLRLRGATAPTLRFLMTRREVPWSFTGPLD